MATENRFSLGCDAMVSLNPWNDRRRSLERPSRPNNRGPSPGGGSVMERVVFFLTTVAAISFVMVLIALQAIDYSQRARGPEPEIEILPVRPVLLVR